MFRYIFQTLPGFTFLFFFYLSSLQEIVTQNANRALKAYFMHWPLGIQACELMR